MHSENQQHYSLSIRTTIITDNLPDRILTHGNHFVLPMLTLSSCIARMIRSAHIIWDLMSGMFTGNCHYYILMLSVSSQSLLTDGVCVETFMWHGNILCPGHPHFVLKFSCNNSLAFVLTEHWLLYKPGYSVFLALQTCYEGLNYYRTLVCPLHHRASKSQEMDNMW